MLRHLLRFKRKHPRIYFACATLVAVLTYPFLFLELLGVGIMCALLDDTPNHPSWVWKWLAAPFTFLYKLDTYLDELWSITYVSDEYDALEEERKQSVARYNSLRNAGCSLANPDVSATVNRIDEITVEQQQELIRVEIKEQLMKLEALLAKGSTGSDAAGNAVIEKIADLIRRQAALACGPAPANSIAWGTR